jgi:hypothetical protein
VFRLSIVLTIHVVHWPVGIGVLSLFTTVFALLSREKLLTCQNWGLVLLMGKKREMKADRRGKWDREESGG